MEVSSSQNINFGRNIVDNVNLRKKTFNGAYKFASATISKLEPNNEKDIKLLNNIAENWRKGTTFSQEIIYNFMKGKQAVNTYIVELKNNCFRIKDKVCCMLETTNPEHVKNKDLFKIKFIQSAPAIADKQGKSPIKGAGELCVYEAVKTAKNNGFKNVYLESAKDSFYDKIGFEKVGKSAVYKLSEDKYDSFLNRVAEKYKLK